MSFRSSVVSTKCRFDQVSFRSSIVSIKCRSTVNLASLIGYNGGNIAFVFYKSQVRKFMRESTCSERNLEILRASCVGQPRELENLVFAAMKNLSTSKRVEKAIARLHERYGVLGGLITEPEIVGILAASRVAHTVASLKIFNKDLNS